MIYLVKKFFKIAGSFAFAYCQSRCWLNFALIAGWLLPMHVIQWLPSCHHRCGGRRVSANTLTIFPCNGCPKSSTVSQNVTIDVSSPGIVSCSFSCTAVDSCGPLSQCCKVPYSIPYTKAAAQIDSSRSKWYACLVWWISVSLSFGTSLHDMLPQLALQLGWSANGSCVHAN